MRNVLDWLEAAAARAPQHTAYDQPQVRMSWSELWQRAREIGSFLAGRVPQQCPVLILMEKSGVHCGDDGKRIRKLFLYAARFFDARIPDEDDCFCASACFCAV